MLVHSWWLVFSQPLRLRFQGLGAGSVRPPGLPPGGGRSYADRMVGAAMSRRAGLGSVATALAVALTAGTGCGSPAARHAPEQGHLGARVAAQEPKPVAVSLPRIRGGLPWPVALQTAQGRYVIARSGVIRWLGAAARHVRAPLRHPAGFVWVDRFAGTWAVMRGGHLVIGRNRAVLWQSAARYQVKDAAHMNQTLTGRPGVAFEVRESGPWYMAGWHGPVHQVAVAGWPETWTRSGNLIGVLHRPGSRSFGYAVFSPSGARLATLATGLSVSEVDQRGDDLATGTFWYLTGSGDLVQTDGVATSVITNTRALGFTSVPQVGILGGGLIDLLSAGWRQGQVILYPDGRLFARIPAPRGQVAGFGALSVSPSSRMVAYILTKEPGNGSTVFLVRPGSAPVPVYHTAHGGSPCAPPPLAWHGSWLSYTPPRGHPVLIDTAGSHRIIRLPSTLPGGNGRTVRVQAISWR